MERQESTALNKVENLEDVISKEREPKEWGSSQWTDWFKGAELELSLWPEVPSSYFLAHGNPHPSYVSRHTLHQDDSYLHICFISPYRW